MLFSRLWLVLMAVAVALLVGATQLAPKPGVRALAEAHSYKLDLVQHNAELLLKLDARALIDGAADMARDSRLVDVLEQASAKQKEIDQLKQRSAAVLQQLISQTTAAARPELLILVDYRGKQIGRLGPGAAKMKAGRDGLIGYPLVAAALRGFQVDGSWSLDNHLYLMGAAPVISRGRNRYVGALLIGQEVDADFAKRFKRRLVGSQGSFLANTDIAFFLRGKLLSSSSKDTSLTGLPQHFSRRRDKLLELGRSPAFSVGRGSSLIAVMAPVRGGAMTHDAFYAVVTQAPRAPGLIGWIGKLRKGDVTSGLLLLLGGLLLLVVIVGLILLQVEHNGPQKRLYDDVHRLTQADISRLEEHRHSGILQRLARAINEIIDRTPRRGGKDINHILDDHSRLPEPENLGMGLGGAMPPLASPGGAPSLGVIANAGVEVDGPSIDRLPMPADGAMPLQGLGGRQPKRHEVGARVDVGGALDLDIGGGAPAPFALDPIGGSGADDGLPALTPMGLPPLGESEPPSLGLQVQVTSDSTKKPPRIGSTTATTLPSVADDHATPNPSSTGAVGVNAASEEEAYFKQVYEEFLAIKRTCGESTDNITYDRFAAKLKKNRQSLRDRYDCQEVRFRVYIKDGKAALKATPVVD